MTKQLNKQKKLDNIYTNNTLFPGTPLSVGFKVVGVGTIQALVPSTHNSSIDTMALDRIPRTLWILDPSVLLVSFLLLVRCDIFMVSSYMYVECRKEVKQQ